MLLIGIVVLICILELGGISCLKQWATSKNRWYFTGGILLYIMVACLLAYSLTLGQLSIVNAMWQVIALLLVTAVSIFFFKEHLTTIEWVGLGVISVGFVIMVFSKM